MAVYTHVSAEDIDVFLARYDAGRLVSAKGIAEGVENSNYLLETTGSSDNGEGQRFILTLYEKRVDEADLPFFMDLLDHLGARGCRVPRFIADREGRRLQHLAGRPACLIEFLTGISVTEPTAAQAHAAGMALGELHKAAQGFAQQRPNRLDKAGWHALAARCGADLDQIEPGHHGAGNAVTDAQGIKVRRGQRLHHAGIALPVIGQRQIQRPAGEQRSPQRGLHPRIGQGGLQRGFRPAIKGHMGQCGPDHRLAGGIQRVFLGHGGSFPVGR